MSMSTEKKLTHPNTNPQTDKVQIPRFVLSELLAFVTNSICFPPPEQQLHKEVQRMKGGDPAFNLLQLVREHVGT